MSRPLVVYHGGCRDGFCAAWVAKKAMPDAEFFAGYYGKDPPDVVGRDVFVIDFSYPRVVMDAMAAAAKSLLVLDHHATARDAMAGAPYARFDMNRSGAGMAWDHFFSPKTRPWTVNYVEDRDLWRHALTAGPAVNAYLGTLPYDFDAWDQAVNLTPQEASMFGAVVENKIRHYVTEVGKNARRVIFEGFEVPIVNAPQVDISELVGFLANGETFAMGWWQGPDGRFNYSLRSRGDFDVSELAKRHGGGGHKNAAGFQVDSMIL